MQIQTTNPFEILAEVTATNRLTPEQWREAREALLFGEKPWDYLVSHFNNIQTTPQVREFLRTRPAIPKNVPPEPDAPKSFLGRLTPDPDLVFALKLQDFRSTPAPKKKSTGSTSLFARYKKLTTSEGTLTGRIDHTPDAAAETAKGVRSRKPPIADKWATMTVDALAAAAKAAGYVETPAPNGGVRKMRLLNWCRHHVK